MGTASPWASVVLNLLTRGTPGKEVEKHREETGERSAQPAGVSVCVLAAQLGLTFCNPSSPPGSSLQGILQARILEWVAISFSRGNLPDSEIEPRSLALQADSFPSEPPGKSSQALVVVKAFPVSV